MAFFPFLLPCGHFYHILIPGVLWYYYELKQKLQERYCHNDVLRTEYTFRMYSNITAIYLCKEAKTIWFMSNQAVYVYV